jgi:hypothetical protein
MYLQNYRHHTTIIRQPLKVLLLAFGPYLSFGFANLLIIVTQTWIIITYQSKFLMHL